MLATHEAQVIPPIWMKHLERPGGRSFPPREALLSGSLSSATSFPGAEEGEEGTLSSGRGTRELDSGGTQGGDGHCLYLHRRVDTEGDGFARTLWCGYASGHSSVLTRKEGVEAHVLDGVSQLLQSCQEWVVFKRPAVIGQGHLGRPHPLSLGDHALDGLDTRVTGHSLYVDLGDHQQGLD